MTEENKRLIHLYRFYDAQIIHLSMDNTKNTETVTFTFEDKVRNTVQDRWCYYDTKFRGMLLEAMQKDKLVNILVERYLKKVDVEKDGETKQENIIEEWLKDVSIICRS